MPGTYSVRAAASIARRGAGHHRRRAGLVFGEADVLVSTEGVEGAVAITEPQLLAILGDSNLRAAASRDTTDPGLRVKEIGALPSRADDLFRLLEAARQTDAPIPLVPFDQPEDAEDAEQTGAPVLPKRGRPRKEENR